MSRFLNPLLAGLAFLTLLASCSPSRNLVYFSDLQVDRVTTPIQNKTEPKIQPDDLLSITVSSMSPESNALFNNGALEQPGLGQESVSAPRRGNEGYLVDRNGNISFPVLGTIKLAGLTKEEATNKLTEEISKDVKKPIINVRFLNFKVTVIGEVVKPSTFTISTDKISLIEALALAGDLTPYGKRENILIIREKEGSRTTARVNLNNKDVLNSPYFYLQQNDVVYVEPDKTKEAQINLRRADTQFAISVGLSAISVLTILLTNLSR